LYSRWAWRALKLWREVEEQQRVSVFNNCGVLWLAREEDSYTRASVAALARWKVPCEHLTPADFRRRFPQFNSDDVGVAYFEPRGGYLRARRATVAVAEAVAHHPRGRVVLATSQPPLATSDASSASLGSIELTDGSRISAGAYVFACGPWLPQLFPEALGERIRVTKQEVFYFGTLPGDARFSPPQLPAWIEISESFYGIPAGDGCGLKVADDASSTPFEPTHGERIPAPERLEAARRYLARRFPALVEAPLVESKVCQYERTPDRHLVIDRHPQRENVWLAGGGSGHGFKLGPAVGEFLARHVVGSASEPIPAELRIGAIAFSGAADLGALRSI
jgi:glycine/D-amino acid oxidase-like deaminating enzyme